VEGIAQPLVLAGGALRLDPAGSPPATTASYQRLLIGEPGSLVPAEAHAFVGSDPQPRMFYGTFTYDIADVVPGIEGGRMPGSIDHHPAVWIVEHGVEVATSTKPVPVTDYRAVDPVTTKLLFQWRMDDSTAKPLPIPFPSASEGPSELSPTGILNVRGQFHATWWQDTNSWAEEVAPGQYLNVFAGGEPVDPSLQNTATRAGVLVMTPADHVSKPTISTGTRYLPSPAPSGKFQIVSASGSVLTLQLVGTTHTYTFDTATDTFRTSP
jgi:hypothetical protein